MKLNIDIGGDLIGGVYQKKKDLIGGITHPKNHKDITELSLKHICKFHPF